MEILYCVFVVVVMLMCIVTCIAGVFVLLWVIKDMLSDD